MQTSDERNQRVMTVVAAAREHPAGEREQYVRLACQGDDELLREVSDFLDWEARMGDFLLDPRGRTGEMQVLQFPTVTPTAIGPYRLLQKIGEGGMAEVWLAEQIRPLYRRIALKLIKPGMDSKAMIARFESERQALALMEHPAIAKVFDAGSTSEDRPYFVMEYVPGLAITEYCDHHRLTIRDRLALFIQVCEGVQHAHQKAIIHRDLKPSNVLVTFQEDKPVPKIIDFGVAKALAQRLTDKTMFTELGVLVGTPEYMSPEQADLTGNIDTRTDVYSLGIILYELLAGGLPFKRQKPQRTGLDEILRQTREEDPPRPSTKVRTHNEASATAARNRNADRPALRRQLAGDLDCIALKALERDRTRRYQSASDFAADIGRYLRHEPLEAIPPNVVYRTRKFVRRHRFGVSVAAGLIVLLLGFAVSMTRQAQRTARQRDRANREAEISRRVKDFMTGLFQVSDPGESRGNTITVREILDRGAKQIDGELHAQPEVQAELMHTMGVVYRSLGLYSQAAPLLERAVLIRRQTLGPEDASTLNSMNALAIVYRLQHRLAEAEKLHRETLELLRRKVGPDRPETIEALNNLARVRVTMGRTDARPLLVEALERARRTLGRDDKITRQSMMYLAMASEDGRGAEAEKLFREVLAANRRILGPEHPETLVSMTNLGVGLMNAKRYEEAAKLYRQAIDIQTRVLGPEHPNNIVSMDNLGYAQMEQHHYQEAEQTLQEALSRARRVLGDRHGCTTQIVYNLACLAALRGRHKEALAGLERAINDDVGVSPFLKFDSIAGDDDLKSLHGDPRFKVLLDRLR